jgi:hypothetical protein
VNWRPRHRIHFHASHAHVDTCSGEQISPRSRDNESYSAYNEKPIMPQDAFER